MVGKAQPQHVLVALREMLPGAAIVGEDLLEARTGQAIANAARDFAEVEPFTGRIGRAERARHTAAQVLRADKQRLGGFVPQFDQANGLTG